MLKRALAIAATVVAIGITAGCQINLTADVYTTDLRDAVAGTEGLTAPATMAFQVPSTDDCDEHTVEISKIMEGVVSDFSPKGCESVEMNSFLLSDTQIPILDSKEAWSQTDSLFGLIARKYDDQIAVVVVMNLDKYGTLTSRMKDKFHQTIDLGSSKISLVLNNDERGDISFGASDVFVNSEPVHLRETYSLQRRQRVEIRLSNVASAYLAKHGRAVGFTLAEDQS